VSVLGYGLQLDLDTRILSISWKVVICGANTTSEDPFWDDRVPAQCEPFDKALDIYLNEYVRRLSGGQCDANPLPTSSSLSKPIFSSVPHTKLISKRVG